jgi:nitrate reductase NapE component
LGGEVGGPPSRSRLTTSVLVVVVVVVVPLFVRVIFVGGVCSLPWSFSFSVGPWDSVRAIVQHID